MDNTVIIKSAHDGTVLEFSRSDTENYRVDLVGPECKGTRLVYAYEPRSHHLVGFFQDMATNWRGWTGKKEWQSVEGEMRLSAVIDSAGHISLTVELRSESISFDWRLSVVLLIESGDLDRIAREIKKFINPEAET
jgi:hypothetical protein